MSTFDLNKVYGPLLAYPYWVVALSGGLDSSVLLSSTNTFLNSLPKTNKRPELLAIHIDHHLSPNHEDWVRHCESFCSNLNIPLFIEHVSVDESSGDGLERAARKARYEAYAKHLTEQSVLLMGHHANDQAETLLMRLFRGTGMQGASAIPKQRPFVSANIERPLLELSRSDLFEYAKQHKLHYIEDESNTDDKFDRNYVRLRLLPLIIKRWPQAVAALTRFANHAAKSEALNNDLGHIDFEHILSISQKYGENLNLKKLVLLADYRRHNLYRYWLKKYIHYLPTSIQINQLDDLIMNKRGGSQCHVGNLSFRIHQNSVYCVDNLWLERLQNTAPINEDWNPAASKPLMLTALGALSAMRQKGQKGLTDGEYRVSFRHVDSVPCVCRINDQTKSVNKLMQEIAIPAWLRDVYPIIYSGKKIAAIGDEIICDEFSKSDGWQVKWQYE